MKRRVALARALARPGDLLLLDEPFTGMDIDLKKKLFSLLQEAAIRRLVVLVTTIWRISGRWPDKPIEPRARRSGCAKSEQNKRAPPRDARLFCGLQLRGFNESGLYVSSLAS